MTCKWYFKRNAASNLIRLAQLTTVLFLVNTGKKMILLWRHNGRDGVSNHQPHHCLLNRLFRGRSKKTSKLHVTGLCAGNSPVTGDFPAQRASNAEMFPFDGVIMPEFIGRPSFRPIASIFIGGAGWNILWIIFTRANAKCLASQKQKIKKEKTENANEWIQSINNELHFMDSSSHLTGLNLFPV